MDPNELKILKCTTATVVSRIKKIGNTPLIYWLNRRGQTPTFLFCEKLYATISQRGESAIGRGICDIMKGPS